MSLASNFQGRYRQAVVSLQTRRGAPGVRSRCCRRQPSCFARDSTSNRHAPPAGAPGVAHRLVADQVGLCGPLNVGCGPAGVATAACRRSAVPAAHVFSASDEAIAQTWVENPYWQHFCVDTYLQTKLPLDASSLTRLEEVHRRRRRRAAAAANDRGRAPGGRH